MLELLREADGGRVHSIRLQALEMIDALDVFQDAETAYAAELRPSWDGCDARGDVAQGLRT